MRRFTLSVLLALFTIAGMAAELNIYASGLRLHGASPVTGENQVHIDYFLNAPATDLKFVVLDATTGAEKTSVTIPAGDANANYTKGLHEDVVVNLSTFFGAGDTYKWALRATGAANTALTQVSNTESFYSVRGVAVNNYPETDGFGKVYISMVTSGTSGNVSKTKGIFVYNPLLSCLNTSIVTGIKDASWATAGAGNTAVSDPYRVTVAEDGDLYISNNKTAKGVWRLDGVDHTAAVQKVIDGGTPYGLCVVGTGANRVIYTLDGIAYSSGCVGNIYSYAIGNNSLPYTGGSSTFRTAAQIGLGNAHCAIESDKHGGFWIAQNRDADAGKVGGLAILAHLTSTGVKNYNSQEEGLGLSYSKRGGLAVNKDGSKVAICTENGKVKVFSAVYNNSVPTLTLEYTMPSQGTNVDGVAFDYANNLYMVSSSSERLHVFAPVNTANTCTTPAASSRTIVLESYTPLIHVTGVTLNETSHTLPVGKSFTLTATVAPQDASMKTCTWATSDASVATVVGGVVKAVAPGTADITVTTLNGAKTDKCTVTVTNMAGTYNVGGQNADYTSLAAACADIDAHDISGDVTLLICSNLTETQNSGIVNNTNHTITIRPDADEDRTIEFTKTSDNSGPSGAFFIGCDMTLTHVDKPTNNVIVDGYAVGGSTRRLTMLIQQGFGSAWGPVIFYGQTEGCVVKNMRIINTVASGSSNYYGIILRPANGTNHTPTGVVIENNYIENKTHNVGQAIVFLGSGASSSAGYPTGTIIRNNEIVASSRGIFFNYANSTTIEGNTFRIQQKGTALQSHGIMGLYDSGVITVRNNKFIELPSAVASAGSNYEFGMQAITASGGATKWIIENNYFAGLNATNASVTSNSIRLVYIRCGNPCEIRHNTFYMPSLTKKPASPVYTSTGQTPITCVWFAANGHIVENNLFVSAETTANNSFLYGNVAANTVLNNVYYHAGGNAYIVAGAASKQDWAAFTQGGANAGSAWVQPTFADAANGNLALTVSNDDMKMARLDEVLKDINGTDRAASTYAGAYELQDVPVTSVAIDQSNMALLPGDHTVVLTATVEPANTTYNTITWASNNDAVTVNPNTGAITAVSVGTAQITATIGGVTSAPITIEVANPVAHVLPYGLNRVLNNDKNSYTFSFKSNIAATSGKLVFYQGGVLKGEVAITDPIVKGENNVLVAKTALPQIDGEMTWAVELSAAESKVIGELTNPAAGIYNFLDPQGVAVDNSPESPYFGNIYITEPVDGTSSGKTDRAKTQQAGLFVYDLQLNELNPTNQGYQLGLTLPAATRHGFKRVNVDAQGNVYVNSNEAIYKANPADLTTSTTLAANKFTAINSFCIDGDIFYVMDNGTALKKLEAGNVSEIVTEASHLVNSNAADNNVVQDGHGGWWIAQSRANSDVYYSLCHVNAAKEMDFTVLSSNQAILGDCNPKSTRGGLALNSDKTILAMSSNSTVIFFDLAYDSNGTPTITRKPWTLPTLGYNIDGVAFDYADNLYVVSNSAQRFYAYSLPKAVNTTLVPAKSTLTVDAQQHIAVTSITLSQTSASLEIGETLDLTATCLPDEATSKTVEWSSDNTAVADVNPTTGRVTAVSVGTAHIKATSTVDGIDSETCEVTVYTLDFNVTWETNGAPYTSTQLSSNSDLWSQFMTGYNTYYEAKGKSHRDIQPMTAVSVFAYHGVIDLLTDPVSPWKWLGDYMLATADAQGVTLTTESEWTTALQDFFSCTAVKVNFAEAGQVAAWLPLWKNANNYLPATMRATDAMPTIRRGAYTFMGWYDNSECTGTPVASVTADITLYALWYAPLTLDETAANADNIAANNGRTLNVIFNRRFEVADGWYTLVLPFDLTAAQMAEAFGADYRLCELETSYLKSETMMYLRFRDVDDLEAGKPYLFKTGVDITDDIVFNAVTINNATPQVVTDKVTMIGLYDQTVVGASDLNYYLGYEDYLYEYLTDKTTKAFRCYFHFASPSLIQGRNARVIFRDDVTTDLEDETFETAPAVQKIIRNGQLIIIRDGIEYNAQGQVVK